MRVPHNADRAKVITACATLARTSWHVDDDEMADVMRQHCCVARDAVDRMHDRIREIEAENARVREESDKWLRQAAFEHRLCVMRQVSLAPHNYKAVERDYVRGWADDETAERLYPLDAKRGTHG